MANNNEGTAKNTDINVEMTFFKDGEDRLHCSYYGDRRRAEEFANDVLIKRRYDKVVMTIQERKYEQVTLVNEATG